MGKCTHKGRDFYKDDPVKLERYDMAIKHCDHARAAGWDSDRIHDMFEKIMNGEKAECPACQDDK